MITWQDPVALLLALGLIVLSLWWRRRLIQRGTAPQCTKCSSGDREVESKAGPKPVVVDVSRLRIGRDREVRS